MTSLFEPLTLAHGPAMSNRFMLAPLTDKQSLPDGRMSDAEYRWLAMRAWGGYGAAMTCASAVQRNGLVGLSAPRALQLLLVPLQSGMAARKRGAKQYRARHHCDP